MAGDSEHKYREVLRLARIREVNRMQAGWYWLRTKIVAILRAA